MISRPGEDDWDFRPVFDLIHSLSISGGEHAHQKTISSDTDHDSPEQATYTAADKVHHQETQLGDFDKIWQYLGQPLDLPAPTVTTGPLPSLIDAWDGQPASEQRVLKVVRWEDDIDCANLADNDESNGIPDLSKLTKQQRKKARRKQRLENREALAAQLTNRKYLPSGSEDESGKETQEPKLQDRSAVIYQFLHGTPPSNGTGRLRSGKVFRGQDPDDAGALPAAASSSPKKVIQILKPVWEGRLEVGAAKKKKLMSMLNEKFVDDRQYLRNLSITQTVANSPDATAEGIHVFVDASNIMIGFHDALKMSRGQPISHRIRRQPISFHNLSLILERGRPTAKRILVGSDNFPAMVEAKQIGYETNILDRVHKAKEMTPRQKRYSNSNGNSGPGGGQSGTGSGSETTAAAQYAPEKWVEQAVDEILHLKMMESVVDAEEPSTMVLATGDAAEAEYSGGFLKMVDRALGKGWNIELASFKHNTSGAYKRRDFRQKWGKRFKIVELDDFVEVLLGSE